MNEQNTNAEPTPEPTLVSPNGMFGNLMAETEAEVEKFTQEANAAPTQADATTAAMLRIAQSMETMMQRQEAVRQIPFNEMKPHTPFNPTGKRVRKEFERPTFLHGIALNPLTHTEAEMALFNALRPGRYLDRRVEVQRNSGDGAINVQWKGKQIDGRMQFYAEFPSITSVLVAVLKEREEKLARKRLNIVEDDDEL